MKTAFILVFVLLASSAFSQVLPKKSPKSEIEQLVGLNEIELVYSRPNANGRTLFGDLVPYGKVWRLGANEPTIIDLKYPIMINNQTIDSGSYAVFAIPYKSYWKVVFNTDTEQWGSSDYDEAKNVVEYTAAVSSCNHVESFTLSFEDVDEASAILAIRWGTTEVKVPFTTDTESVVQANIKTALAENEDLAKVYFGAASYYFGSSNLEQAKKYLAESMKIEESYYNTYLKARILNKEGDVENAQDVAESAAEMAEKAEKQGWADYIRRNAADW
jgi:tetratricopeptide (TPR) repeat protein